MDSSAGSWTAGQVARHLGIAESTLRSWHRRYGIGPQGREPGRYRRYSEGDVARLRQMLDLIKLGMLASEAARAVQTGEPQVVSAERDVADLVAAARAADPERCRIVLDNVLVRRGVAEAWEAVCRRALAIVDADQRDDPDCMDVEHALSWAMLAALHRVPTPPIAPGSPLILLACVEGEHHTLPLAALAAALGSHRVPVRMLGAATPTRSVVRAVRDTAPSAVVLWSQRSDTAARSILRPLVPYPVSVFTAGPGWPGPVPARADSAPRDLDDDLAAVEHLAGLSEALVALLGPAFTEPGPVPTSRRPARSPTARHAPHQTRTQLEPQTPFEPQTPLEPQGPLEPQAPLKPQAPLEPQTPLEPQSPLEPQAPLEPQSPLEPQAPLEPQSPLQPPTAVQSQSPHWSQESLQPQNPDRPQQPLQDSLQPHEPHRPQDRRRSPRQARTPRPPQRPAGVPRSLQ